jgi:hypothetical protein
LILCTIAIQKCKVIVNVQTAGPQPGSECSTLHSPGACILPSTCHYVSLHAQPTAHAYQLQECHKIAERSALKGCVCSFTNAANTAAAITAFLCCCCGRCANHNKAMCPSRTISSRSTSSNSPLAYTILQAGVQAVPSIAMEALITLQPSNACVPTAHVEWSAAS